VDSQRALDDSAAVIPSAATSSDSLEAAGAPEVSRVDPIVPEIEYSDGWGPDEEKQLAQVNDDREALEQLRQRLPPGEYVSRLHEILARRRALTDTRRRATAVVVDGSIVTLEDPDGQTVTARISNSVTIHATRDGWIQPSDTFSDGISTRSALGMALLGCRVGQVASADGVDYRIVDINER
jgi:transcription elongation GreA/GreB family factor